MLAQHDQALSSLEDFGILQDDYSTDKVFLLERPLSLPLAHCGADWAKNHGWTKRYPRKEREGFLAG